MILSRTIAALLLFSPCLFAASTSSDEGVDPGIYPGGTDSSVSGWTSLPSVQGSRIDNTTLTVGGNATLLHYIDANYDPSKIKRAVIQIHGENRDAWNQWLYSDLAANRAAQGGLIKRDEVLILAPQFFISVDRGAYPYDESVVAPSNSTTSTSSSTRTQSSRSRESISTRSSQRRYLHSRQVPPLDSTTSVLIWSGNSWGEGSPAFQPTTTVGTFEALDSALTFLLDTSRFPSLNKVVVAGFSLGAQLTQRYAAFRPASDDDDRIQYWISSPNSFVYFNDTRPLRPGRQCRDTFNNYKYGLAGPVPSYITSVEPTEIQQRFMARSITYLCGVRDKTAAVNDCSADTQGTHHVSKMAYWTEEIMPGLNGGSLPTQSQVKWVARTGHQDWKIITSDPGVYGLYLRGWNDDGTDATPPPSNGVTETSSPRGENSGAMINRPKVGRIFAVAFAILLVL